MFSKLERGFVPKSLLWWLNDIKKDYISRVQIHNRKAVCEWETHCEVLCGTSTRLKKGLYKCTTFVLIFNSFLFNNLCLWKCILFIILCAFVGNTTDFKNVPS